MLLPLLFAATLIAGSQPCGRNIGNRIALIVLASPVPPARHFTTAAHPVRCIAEPRWLRIWKAFYSNFSPPMSSCPIPTIPTVIIGQVVVSHCTRWSIFAWVTDWRMACPLCFNI